MFPIVMQAINDQEPTKWIENINAYTTKQLYLDKWTNSFQKVDFKLQRLIENNKFIIEFKYLNYDQEIDDIDVKCSVNNQLLKLQKVFDSEKHEYTYTLISEFNEATKTKKVQDIKNINFEIFYKVKGLLYQVERYTYEIYSNNNSNKELVSNKNGVEYDLWTKLRIMSLPDRDIPTDMKHYSFVEQVKYKFIPTTLMLGKHNEKLFDVEISKKEISNKSGITSDFSQLIQSDINGFNVSIDIDKQFIKGNLNAKINDFDKNEHKQISIDSYSYYDKVSKAIIANNDSIGATRGLLLPLNYSGNYSYLLNVNFGEDLKGFKIRYNQEISKPFFNEKSGLIKLSVNNIFKQQNFTKWSVVKAENIRSLINNSNTLEELMKGGK